MVVKPHTKKKRKKFIVRGTSKKKSFTARLKPNELATREQQMKEFRYQCAKVTGNVMYFFANIYIGGVFVIFMTLWLSGMYEGTQISGTFRASFSMWREIISSIILILTPVSILLTIAVKMLTYDAKGRMLKITRVATERSMYFLILIMVSISILYFDEMYWHI